MPDLIVEGLVKQFGNQVALDDVTFTVRDGEFFTLLGPSGCGKSTTLASIAGLEQPDQGAIKVGEHVFVDAKAKRFLAPEVRNLGMVFQSYALWPHMTVASNLALPLRLRNVPKREQRRLIDETLDQVDLLPQRDRYPHQLSGGQQQRVALARALVYSPSLLLLDEPLSNLDAKLRESARAWLKNLQKEIGITTVYVTHDQLEALSLSDRLAIMRDGHMLQVGTPKEIYEQPVSPNVADFIGRCNFFSAHVLESRDNATNVLQLAGDMRLQLKMPMSAAPGSRVTIGIRAEHLRVLERQQDKTLAIVNALPAKLRELSYVGARYEYTVEALGQIVFAESNAEVREEDLWLMMPESNVYVFPEQTPPDRVEDAELWATE
jgi:iron(III) transport system ATP-binding protein